MRLPQTWLPSQLVHLNLAAWTEFRSFQQELATEEVEQWVRSEQYNTELREKLDTLEKTVKVELNFTLGENFGMTREGTKIMSVKSIAVIKW